MKGATVAAVGGGVVFLCFLLLGAPPEVRSDRQENHCFTCHTNPRKLIEITREIARVEKGRPGASIETEGEG